MPRERRRHHRPVESRVAAAAVERHLVVRRLPAWMELTLMYLRNEINPCQETQHFSRSLGYRVRDGYCDDYNGLFEHWNSSSAQRVASGNNSTMEGRRTYSREARSCAASTSHDAGTKL